MAADVLKISPTQAMTEALSAVTVMIPYLTKNVLKMKVWKCKF